MSNTLTDQLFALIQSMTKSEKRHFKLFVQRSGSRTDLLFVKVFDALEQQKTYDEERLLKKVRGLRRAQLSNVKKHLYNQLLSSLRLLAQDDAEMKIRAQLDYARILYHKGLFLQSLRMLEKSREEAEKMNQPMLLAQILEAEKNIELRHITRSPSGRAMQLSLKGAELRQHIARAAALSELALSIYNFFIINGPAKDAEDYEEVTRLFHTGMPSLPFGSLTFNERVSYCQACVWYNLVIQNFVQCYRYAHSWVMLFDVYPEQRQLDAALYLKGLHNELTALFYCGDVVRFSASLSLLEKFIETESSRFSLNTQLTAFVYHHTNKLNLFFMEGRFTDGVDYVPHLLKQIRHFGDRIDQHRLMIFWYKIACIYFGHGDHHSCMRYLQKIINYPTPQLREDVQVFSRLLYLVACFESGDDDLLEYQIRSTYRFLLKMRDLGELHKEVLRFLRQSGNLNRSETLQAFRDLKQRLEHAAEAPFQRRMAMYLDVISWLESKIEQVPVQEIIRRKALKKIS
ncbi:MAG: hypothetical protein IM638_15565 [Bacteroidetes bacterium]|nr:hypothetical protein [Bacteroidota bacterium]